MLRNKHSSCTLLYSVLATESRTQLLESEKYGLNPPVCFPFSAHRKAAGKRTVHRHPSYCSASIKNRGRQQKKMNTF